MSYRPICDTWLLARSKTKYYGAYPGGFLSRAMDLLGTGPESYVLHVCGGKVKDYPFRGLGGNHVTVDIDPAIEPDIVADVRTWIPPMHRHEDLTVTWGWDAILADPPYTEGDAAHYAVQDVFPEPNKLLKDCINAVKVGGKVGMLHYVLPRCPKNARFIACVGVIVGFGNRMRCYSVFERTV